MKKKIALVLAAMMAVGSMGMASFAEETEAQVTELNWEAVSEEVAAMGEFQQIEITDLPTICFWIPSGLESTDVSVITVFPRPQSRSSAASTCSRIN